VAKSHNFLWPEEFGYITNDTQYFPHTYMCRTTYWKIINSESYFGFIICIQSITERLFMATYWKLIIISYDPSFKFSIWIKKAQNCKAT